MERIPAMRNKSGLRRFSRGVGRDYAREFPEGLWNTEISRIYGIYETFGKELIFKRVKGMGIFAPILTTASRNSGLQSASSDFPEWGQLFAISPALGTSKRRQKWRQK